jgi:proteasome beta subunit
MSDPSPAAQRPDGFRGDFLDLLSARGYGFGSEAVRDASAIGPTESTTVLAVRYGEGVVVAGDRRATAGTAVVYDRADKVLDIDEYSALAISGSPAIAYEMARVLEYSFRYYRRSQLQELSLEGKLRTLSRLLRDNIGMAVQGIGAVLPIFAAYDVLEHVGRICFYDVLGAQFEVGDFAAAGSGSIWIRGALYYLNRWERPLAEMGLRESVAVVLRMLDAAAEYDAATGGYNRRANIFPLVKHITQEGIRRMDDNFLREVYSDAVEVAHV